MHRCHFHVLVLVLVPAPLPVPVSRLGHHGNCKFGFIERRTGKGHLESYSPDKPCSGATMRPHPKTRLRGSFGGSNTARGCMAATDASAPPRRTSHLTSPDFTSHHLPEAYTSAHLTSHHLTLHLTRFHLASPHVTAAARTSLHLPSPHVMLPHPATRTSIYLTSPHFPPACPCLAAHHLLAPQPHLPEHHFTTPHATALAPPPCVTAPLPTCPQFNALHLTSLPHLGPLARTSVQRASPHLDPCDLTCLRVTSNYLSSRHLTSHHPVCTSPRFTPLFSHLTPHSASSHPTLPHLFCPHIASFHIT